MRNSPNSELHPAGTDAKTAPHCCCLRPARAAQAPKWRVLDCAPALPLQGRLLCFGPVLLGGLDRIAAGPQSIEQPAVLEQQVNIDDGQNYLLVMHAFINGFKPGLLDLC
jgi:hypothetical protein